MGHFDVVVDLVEAGADVQFTCTGKVSQDSSFATGVTLLVYIKAAQPALNAACEQGHYKIAEYLLDHGAFVNAKSGVSSVFHGGCFVLLPSHRSSK